MIRSKKVLPIMRKWAKEFGIEENLKSCPGRLRLKI